MTERRGAEALGRAGPLCLGLLLLAAALAGTGLAREVPPRLWWPGLVWPDPASVGQVLAAYSTLPRLAAALLAGAALGLSGSLLQRLLRNPLASPGTLGISAGAHLALAAAQLYAPGLLAVVGRDAVAFAGGAGLVGLVLFTAWRGGLSPGVVVLAGLASSLYASALGTLLVLLHTRALLGLFVWGSGSLVQTGWAVSAQLLPRLLAAALATALLARPMRVMELPDEEARALGVPVATIRLAGLGIAVALAASVVSLVGVIGFVGLAAPMMVRLMGAGRGGPAWSAAMGAALLAATDQVLLSLSGASAALLPTGALTALLGVPLLLWARTDAPVRPAPMAADVAGPIRRALPLLLAGLAALAILAGGALLLGNSLHGWAWDPAMLPLRAPRVAAAGAAGAMLAVAGAVLQRMLGNPVASPEVLGLSTGTVLGLTATLWWGFDGTGVRLLAGAGGAAAALGLVLGYSRGGADPNRVLLAGIALSAVFEAALALLLASGSPQAEAALTWLSGSTYAVDAPLATLAVAAMLVLLLPAALDGRVLDVLALGDGVATALGLRPGRTRVLLLAVVAGLTGVATLLVGPLSFVGLMAPHLARLVGLRRAGSGMAGAALCGATVMVAADWAGRTVMFPTEVPAGLVAALLGGPALLHALSRQRA